MAKSKLVSVSCPKCGKSYRIYQENLGRRGICKQCNNSFSMMQRVKNPSKNKTKGIKPVLRSAPPNESQSKVKQAVQESVEKTISTKNYKEKDDVEKKEKTEISINKAKKKSDAIKTKKEISETPKALPVIKHHTSPKKNLKVLAEQIKLIVNDDMKAYIVAKTKMDDDVKIEDLKKFLESEKIIYGLIDDDTLQKFIDNPLNRIKPFLVARGSEPTAPQHGKIKYFFDIHPLKNIPPNLTENERVDFKERGEIPYVEKGTLIAERIPGIPGKNGKDVYGKRIDAKKAHHVTLRCGNGASLSEDKRVIYARISGMPVASTGRNERVDVLPQYYIKGDVNMKTGNIRFNGPVVINGTVQSGFKVRCASLEANELFRADIEVEGDTRIQGGVVGSKIVCKGSFKTKFVKGSTIECEEDVVVSNGIVDSKIATRNNCIVENNKILTSEIMAFKDIVTMHLGSQKSPGCNLTIGVDPVLYKKMEQLRIEKQQRENELISKKEDLDIENIEELIEALNDIQRKIDDLEPTLSEAKSINKTLIKQYKKMRKSGHTEKLSKVLDTIKAFSLKIGPAKQELHALISERRSIKEALSTIQGLLDTIERNSLEIQSINRQIQTADVSSKVVVRGDVFQGTIIQGISASLEVFDKQSFVFFEEMVIYDENNLPNRQIEVKPLERN